jgi:hypothetical protein
VFEQELSMAKANSGYVFLCLEGKYAEEFNIKNKCNTEMDLLAWLDFRKVRVLYCPSPSVDLSNYLEFQLNYDSAADLIMRVKSLFVRPLPVVGCVAYVVNNPYVDILRRIQRLRFSRYASAQMAPSTKVTAQTWRSILAINDKITCFENMVIEVVARTMARLYMGATVLVAIDDPVGNLNLKFKLARRIAFEVMGAFANFCRDDGLNVVERVINDQDERHDFHNSLLDEGLKNSFSWR